MPVAARDSRRSFLRIEIALDRRIMRRPVRIVFPPPAVLLVFRHMRLDLGAGQEGRVDQPAPPETIKRRPMPGDMTGLPPHRLFPIETEPVEILVDLRLVFGAAAGRIDILDPEKEASTDVTRHVEIENRRQGMAEMELAIRARRESEDGFHAAFLFLNIAPETASNAPPGTRMQASRTCQLASANPAAISTSVESTGEA